MAMLAPTAARTSGVEFYRWWQSGESAVCAIAKRGGASDWAAYIGGVFNWPLAACLTYVAEEGCKLPEYEAYFLFPAMVELARREGLEYRP